MKYAITGIFSILIGIYFGYTNSPTHSYIGTLPLIESMEIGCTNSYPLSEKCIASITPDPCPIHKIAKAVAIQETGNCTKGTARWNNCHGIMSKGKPVRFATKNDSYEAFMSLWHRKYGGCPNLSKAIKYSGNDRATVWLSTVNYHIYEN